MRNAIQISGGVDSMAMLFLLRPQWDDSIVMWCDSGAAYPDVAALMERVRDLVPNYCRVQGHQPESIKRYGWPVDVLPLSHTRTGELAYGPQPIVFQTFFDCCARGLWLPLNGAVLSSGVEVVYRGQRNDDRLQARIPSGHTDAQGIRYEFPLADWSREQTFAYLNEVAPSFVPAYYAAGEKTSRDCWNCTAYRIDNVERVNALPSGQHEQVAGVIRRWEAIVRADLNLQPTL
jgi:3'-phosphoadenosine 5'-phosphosulfate sulfotransferase (PAPS reductase)/FAD synthetase